MTNYAAQINESMPESKSKNPRPACTSFSLIYCRTTFPVFSMKQNYFVGERKPKFFDYSKKDNFPIMHFVMGYLCLFGIQS